MWGVWVTFLKRDPLLWGGIKLLVNSAAIPVMGLLGASRPSQQRQHLQSTSRHVRLAEKAR